MLEPLAVVLAPLAKAPPPHHPLLHGNVLLVGCGAVGKTSLFRRLLACGEAQSPFSNGREITTEAVRLGSGPAFAVGQWLRRLWQRAGWSSDNGQVNTSPLPLDGLNIQEWAPALPARHHDRAAAAALQVWDFTWQTTFYSMRHFISLRRQNVGVVVYNPKTDEGRVDVLVHWVHSVLLGVPVVLVATHRDQDGGTPMASLTSEHVFKHLHVSNVTGEGIGDLVEAIVDAIFSLSHSVW